MEESKNVQKIEPQIASQAEELKRLEDLSFQLRKKMAEKKFTERRQSNWDNDHFPNYLENKHKHI